MLDWASVNYHKNYLKNKPLNTEFKVTVVYTLASWTSNLMWLFTNTWSPNVVQHSTQAFGVRQGKEPHTSGLFLSLTHSGQFRTMPFARAQLNTGRCLLQHPVSGLQPGRESERLQTWPRDLPYWAGWPRAMALANRMLGLVTQRFAAFSSLTQSLGDLRRTAGTAATVESWSDIWAWHLWIV